MSTPLDQLIRFLDDLDSPATLQQLAAQLKANPGVEELVGEHIRYSEQTYRRNLVCGNDLYNLWVLCWRNGQRSPIHDHRGSNCAVRVLQGVMTETLFEFAPNGMVKPTLSRDLGVGGVIVSQDADLHQVSNLQANDADLVTLHIYSPPLAIMGTYTLQDARRGEEPMHLEFYDAAGI